MEERLDRLTADARTALTFAQEEALRLNQNFIGTEHLILGLLRQDDGPAARLLRSLGVDLERLLVAVRKHTLRADPPPAGLVGEGEGAAARSLESMGVSLELLRPAVASPPPPARVIDGRAIAQEGRAEGAQRAKALAKRGVTPGLALILVGENPSSISYVRSKGDAAEEAGIFSETFQLSDAI